MPHALARAARLMGALALFAGLVSAPGTALAAAPSGASDTWIVTLQRPDARALPARRGGLRPSATAIARDRAAATTRTIEGLQARVGFLASQRYTYALSGFAARLSPVQLASLRRDPQVLSIRRAQRVELAGQRTPSGILRVDAPPSSAPVESENVTVAVVDTGVGHYENGAWRHAGELNLIGGVNAYSPGGVDCAHRAPDPTKHPASFDDTNSHGTHVAGTIGAMQNGIGAVGIAPGVKLLSVRVFDGGDGSDATIICGLDWIAAWNANHPDEEQDIDVVNMSLRGAAPIPRAGVPTGCDRPGNPDPEEIAVCDVIHSGAVVVVAAGNETDHVAGYVPSRYADVITVGAISDFDGLPGGLSRETCIPPLGTELDDTFSRYSNFGPEVDINAPGTCVVSTALDSPGGTTVMSGTSMATPHVTGAIARYLAIHPGTPPDVMARLLVASATVDWDAASAPSGTTDRLLDVGALVASTDAIAIWAVPQAVTVPKGTSARTVKARLQRIGGYDGAVRMSVDPVLPDGVAAVGISGGGVIPSDGPGGTLTIHLDAHPDDGERHLTLHAQGVDGGPSSEVDIPLRFDGTRPAIGAPWPRLVFRTGVYSTAAPLRLSWSATDSDGPLLRQELQRSRDGRAYRVYARPGRGAGDADVTMDRRIPTSWRIKAVDQVGNTTVSKPLTTRVVPIPSGEATLGPGWRMVQRATAADHDLTTTTKAERGATVTFTGRAVAIVAPTGPRKGRFRVRIDGHIVATVDQATPVVTARRILYASTALTPGRHTLTVTTLGGIVELDAFLVLK